MARRLKRRQRRFRSIRTVEPLEDRTLLSMIFDLGAHPGGGHAHQAAEVEHVASNDRGHGRDLADQGQGLADNGNRGLLLGEHKSGHGPAGTPHTARPQGPPIDLFTVALHEFGHALGLEHSDPLDGVASVMDPLYREPVRGLEPHDIARVQGLFPETGLPDAGNRPAKSDDGGKVEISFSFTPDDAATEQGGRNSLHQTLDGLFGTQQTWKQIFRDALSAWAEATTLDDGDDGDHDRNVSLGFVEVADAGRPFNSAAASPGVPDAGEIRIAMHSFDGPGGTLAHAFFSTAGGESAAGDVHFDAAENWQDLRNALVLAGSAADRPSDAAALEDDEPDECDDASNDDAPLCEAMSLPGERAAGLDGGFRFLPDLTVLGDATVSEPEPADEAATRRLQLLLALRSQAAQPPDTGDKEDEDEQPQSDLYTSGRGYGLLGLETGDLDKLFQQQGKQPQDDESPAKATRPQTKNTTASQDD